MPLIKAIQICIKQKNWEQTNVLLLQQAGIYDKDAQKNNLHLNILGRIVVAIKMGDIVAANKIFNGGVMVSGFADSDIGEVAEELLKAWDEGNMDLVAECLGKQTFSFMDNEVYIGSWT